MDYNYSEYYYDSPLKIDDPLNLTDDELNAAAKKMTELAPSRSSTPAGYTYLGQFIDHDLALDESQIPLTQTQSRIARFKNSRTPFFDLETLYGSEQIRNSLISNDAYLRLGPTNTVLGLPTSYDNDLPREPDGTPQVVDKRNDENLIISQLQVAFIKFHNSVVRKLGLSGKAGFDEARRIVIRHYQWVVLEDFLPRIVNADVLAEARAGVRLFYPPSIAEPIMPLEFSVGAFRFGHSMIRNVYTWNDRITDDTFGGLTSIERLMRLNGRFGFDGFNSGRLPNEWLINWRWFFDIDGSQNSERTRFNFAQAVDPSISSRLGSFAFGTGAGHLINSSLSALDLFRARAVGLPSGQAIAARIADSVGSNLQVSVLSSDVIESEIQLSGRITKETPLWLYLLVEAGFDRQGCGTQLGILGSRIVAETVLELMARSEFSILPAGFEKESDFLGINGRFGMPELIKFADHDGDVIDPIGRAIRNWSQTGREETININLFEKQNAKENDREMKIIDKINEIHCRIYADPTGEGGRLGDKLQQKATAIILGTEDHESAMKKYMSEFVVNEKQLDRLMGKDKEFEDGTTWAKKIRAYMVSNSTCGIDTGTGTRNNMSPAMIASLDEGLDSNPDGNQYPID